MAKRIVIADDSATIQRAFAMTFGAEDVTLVAARSVDEGLALARQMQPELVIADGMMPGRSGYDLCAAIKSDPALGSTAVYVLASAQQPYDESRGRQCGADGFFVKPFDTTQIIERVHEALARGPTEVMRPAPAPAPFADDFGPPIPLDGRSPIPLGLGTPLASASDDDEYGEISVDILPVSSDESAPAPEREVEYTAAPPTPPPAGRPSLIPSPTYAPPPGSTPAPSPFFSSTPGSAASPLSTSGSAVSPLPTAGSAASPLPTPGSAAAPSPTAPGMRPSLIPGIRPGAVAPARPGAPPARPTAGVAGGAPMSRPPAPVARTLMGLPAANVPIPGSSRPTAPMSPIPPARPSPAPSVSATPSASASASASSSASVSSSHSSAARPVPMAPPAATPSPLFSSVPAVAAPPAASPTVSAMVSAAVGAAVDQKIAAISARGPEYEAIAKLSREIIEQIVWEVVPELAEVIIREHVERHVRN